MKIRCVVFLLFFTGMTAFSGEIALSRNLLPEEKSLTFIPVPRKQHIVFQYQGTARDFSKYDTLIIRFNTNRAGDSFMLVMTSNPQEGKEWNYYCRKITIEKTGEAVVSIPFKSFCINRHPAGFDDIQSLGIWFEGWGLKTLPGLIFEVRELRLENLEAKERIIRSAEVAKFSKMLPAKPWSIVPDYSDRAFWDHWRNTSYGKTILECADALVEDHRQATAPPDEFYLDFTRKTGPWAGNRARYEQAAGSIAQNVFTLAMACCLTMDAKYMPKLEEFITVWCDGMRSWVCPAHDAGLTNYHRTGITIDLTSSENAALAAQVSLMLKGMLSRESDAKLNREIMRQVINPLDRALADGSIQKVAWWFYGSSNWTAVCHSGLILTLLGTDFNPLRKEELLYEVYKANNIYLKGFLSDGYCTEGPAYWGYGFGSYLLTASSLFLTSEGKIRLLDNPAAQLPAEFPERIRLTPNLYPPIGDCVGNGKIAPEPMAIRDWLLNRRTRYWDGQKPHPKAARLIQLIQMRIPIPPGTLPEISDILPAFSEFPTAKVYVLRPGTNSSSRLSALFKGGSNNEVHNHNDTGNFIIAVDGLAVMVDPGSCVYSQSTFDHNRYKNRIINSYCHNVPCIDGILQIEGKNTEAVITKMKKERYCFEVTFDLRAPYRNISGINKLERTMRYDWEKTGKVTITDSVVFKTPKKYESAFLTFGNWEQFAPDTIVVTYQGKKLAIRIDAGGAAYTLRDELVDDGIACKTPVRRIAVSLNQPVSSARIQFTMVPM